MSHVIKVIVAKRNLANALRKAQNTDLKLVNGEVGPYKVFIPVEVIFDHLAVDELSELLDHKNSLTLTGNLDNDRKELTRSFTMSRKGIKIDLPQKKQNTVEADHILSRIFGLADLWHIRNKCRRFTIYHCECYP